MGRGGSPDVPGDIWAHFSAIDAPGYRGLAEGQAVLLEVQT
jgi:cold shock CspA family protein